MASMTLRNTNGYEYLSVWSANNNLINNLSHYITAYITKEFNSISPRYIDMITSTAKTDIPFIVLGQEFIFKYDIRKNVYLLFVKSNRAITIRRAEFANVLQWFRWSSFSFLFNMSKLEAESIEVNTILLDSTGMEWVVELINKSYP